MKQGKFAGHHRGKSENKKRRGKNQAADLQNGIDFYRVNIKKNRWKQAPNKANHESGNYRFACEIKRAQ